MGPKEIYKNLKDGTFGVAEGGLLVTAGVGGVAQGVFEFGSKVVGRVGRLLGGKQEKSKTLIMYGKNTCMYCQQAKKWLKKHNIKYTFYNVEKNASKLRFLQSKGHTSIPQFYLGNKILVRGGYLGLIMKYDHNVGALKKKIKAKALNGGGTTDDEDDGDDTILRASDNNISQQRRDYFLGLNPRRDYVSADLQTKITIPWEDLDDISYLLPPLNIVEFKFNKIGLTNFRVNFNSGTLSRDGSSPLKLSYNSSQELRGWVLQWLNYFKN
jgi:glutaredoxin